MITAAYITGVQDNLRQNGIINYASEDMAQGDAAALAHGVEAGGQPEGEEAAPVDQGALATEGAHPAVTHIVAKALSDMAQQAGEEAQVAHAKAQIIQGAVDQISGTGELKTASAPGNNNVVAGAKPGHVAKGESNAKSGDHDEELKNAMPNTAHRPDVFNPMPGKTKVKGGAVGKEGAHPGAEGKPGLHKDLNKELKNAMPNTAKRPSVYGKPGHQANKNSGEVGNEKAASLSEYLSSL